MKKILIGILFIAFLAPAYANKTKVKSKIDDVTVYIQGAQIYRSAGVQLNSGISEFVFEDIPVGLDESSLQIKVPDQIKILSVNYRINDHKDENENSQLSELESKLKNKQIKMKKLKKELKVYDEEENILLQNTSFSGKDSGVNLQELKMAADYFRSRLNEIALKKLEIENKMIVLNGESEKIKKQMTKIRNTNPDPTGEVFVKVQAKTAGKIKFRLSYYLNAAGWIPTYDIRVNDISKPLELSVKAKVYQNTGEDWDKVKLVLSTTNPKKSNRKPKLLPWLLSYGRPYIPYSTDITGTGCTVKGKISDAETGEPIPFANVILERNGNQLGGSTTDYNGIYIVNNLGPGYYDLKVSYIGYKTSRTNGVVLNEGRITFYDLTLESSTHTLEEITIESYSIPLIDKDKILSGGSVTAQDIQKMPNRNTMSLATGVGGVFTSDYIPQQQVQTPTNIRYEVDVPYSIPSDGEKYMVRIVDHSIPADYEYYCAPKIDEDVYLVAQLTDWGNLNLLSGESTIYFEGTYMGKSFLDVRSTEDTLSVSVGRDNNVVVVREQNKDLKNIQTIGSNVKETRAYKITVRNNRNVPINLALEDQIPVPTIKDISVDLFDDLEAEHDEDTGILTWKLELDSKQSEELGFGFTVKYPKGKIVVLD
ncbi:MAG: mucoidy inhibitor MuiA family protein [Bacteroidales bacterium]|nr:mucoidy inhibitor MuiA family protein [Bacteroidales bacterium]